MKTKPNEYDYFQTLNLNIYIPDTNILNVLSGRSKNLGTKTALGSYTSANLKMAVNFYEQIIDKNS